MTGIECEIRLGDRFNLEYEVTDGDEVDSVPRTRRDGAVHWLQEARLRARERLSPFDKPGRDGERLGRPAGGYTLSSGAVRLTQRCKRRRPGTLLEVRSGSIGVLAVVPEAVAGREAYGGVCGFLLALPPRIDQAGGSGRGPIPWRSARERSW